MFSNSDGTVRIKQQRVVSKRNKCTRILQEDKKKFQFGIGKEELSWSNMYLYFSKQKAKFATRF